MYDAALAEAWVRESSTPQPTNTGPLAHNTDTHMKKAEGIHMKKIMRYVLTNHPTITLISSNPRSCSRVSMFDVHMRKNTMTPGRSAIAGKNTDQKNTSD
jgi:hypothetical protein